MTSSFQPAFIAIRDAFASTIPSGAEITDIDEKGLQINTLAAVALMLVHNALPETSTKGVKGTRGRKKNTGPRHPLNINTIQEYDLYSFRDIEIFTPYIRYLLKPAKAYNDYGPKMVATFIRYLFVIKKHNITTIASEDTQAD